MIESPYRLAERFIGVTEIPGKEDNPQVLAMLKLDMNWPQGDEVPWCSAFTNYVCWLMRLPRSKSLRARSWLEVGQPVGLFQAEPGHDIVILKRGGGDQPGPDVIAAPGHVGFYAAQDADNIFLLGGNQGNRVCVSGYSKDRLLGVRRVS